jgi:hypothetical protein
VIAAILERADIPAEATEVTKGTNSPISRPRQLLPQSILTALRNAEAGQLVSVDRKMVALGPDDAPLLIGWLRDVARQPGLTDADAKQFRAAADTSEGDP